MTLVSPRGLGFLTAARCQLPADRPTPMPAPRDTAFSALGVLLASCCCRSLDRLNVPRLFPQLCRHLVISFKHRIPTSNASGFYFPVWTLFDIQGQVQDPEGYTPQRPVKRQQHHGPNVNVPEAPEGTEAAPSPACYSGNRGQGGGVGGANPRRTEWSAKATQLSRLGGPHCSTTQTE